MIERLRHLLAEDSDVTEKKMFGGICLLHRGNMLCGITKKGDLMVRIGKEREAIARDTLPGGRDMDFTGKKMGGMLFVDEATVADDVALGAWLELCLKNARSQPAKKPKKPKVPKT